MDTDDRGLPRGSKTGPTALQIARELDLLIGLGTIEFWLFGAGILAVLCTLALPHNQLLITILLEDNTSWFVLGSPVGDGCIGTNRFSGQ